MFLVFSVLSNRSRTGALALLSSFLGLDVTTRGRSLIVLSFSPWSGFVWAGVFLFWFGGFCDTWVQECSLWLFSFKQNISSTWAFPVYSASVISNSYSLTTDYRGIFLFSFHSSAWLHQPACRLTCFCDGWDIIFCVCGWLGFSWLGCVRLSQHLKHFLGVPEMFQFCSYLLGRPLLSGRLIGNLLAY